MKTFLTLPKCADEEQTRVARILYTVAGSTLVGLCLVVVLRLLNDQFQSGPPFLAISIAMGVSVLLTRRGHLKWSSSLVPWSLLAFLSFLCYQNDGLRDTAILAYPSLLVVGGLLLKRKHFFVFTFSSLLSILVLAYLEIYTFVLAPYDKKATYGDIVDMIVILSLTAITVRLLADDLIRSLRKARESSQIIEGIINAIPASVFWKDKNLVYLGCNVAFARDAGFADSKDIIGKDDYQMGWRDQTELYHQDDLQVIKSGIPKLLIEEPQTTPEGNTITLLTSKVPLHDSEGEISGVVGTYMDITDRKKSETALQESEQKFRLIFEANPLPMWFFDPVSLVFLDVNEAAINHYGYSREEFLSMTIKDILPPDDVVRLPNNLAKGKAIDTTGQRRHKKKDGTIINVAITLHGIEYSGRQVKVALAHDITRRVQEERELKKLSTALEQTADSILITDTDGVIEYVNPAFEMSTGYAKEFAVGKTPAILKSGKLSKNFYKTLWNTILSGKVFRAEFINRKSNGDLYYEQQTISPVFDTGGSITHFVGAGRDVTEQRELEEEHRRAERDLETAHGQLKNIFDNLDAVFFSIDTVNDRLLQVSPACKRIFGYPPEAFFKNPRLWMDINHPDFNERQLLNGVQMVYESGIIRADGEHRWIETRGTPVLDGAGKLIRIDGIVSDITKRKQSDEALHQSELRYRTLFQEMRDGVFMSMADGKLVDVNPAVMKVLGYDSKEEMFKLSFPGDIFLHPSDWDRLLERLSREDYVEDFETVHKRKDGQLVGALLSVAAVRNADGTISMIRGLLQDVTKQRQLEQQLIQAQKMESLGTLAGGIAHDFNNILGIILGHSAMIETPGVDPSRVTQSAQTITKFSQRGAALVRQLLTFARKTDVTLGSVMINEIVVEIVQLLGETIPRIIAVTTDLTPRLPSIIADVTQIHQVLLNLCLNARDAMLPKGGTLSITTKLVSNETVRLHFPKAGAMGYVLLSVADTGVGMDETTRARIFEPFFTTKGQGKGTGLGLATVYGIVEGHDGFIDVASEPGQGTTFTIYLPVPEISVAQSPETTNVENDVRGGTETILIVEDETGMADLLEEILTQKGYRILTAQDGLKGLEIFAARKDEIALVFTDMGLPKLDGGLLLARLLELKSDTKVVIASGYLEPSKREELSRAGAKAFISKPYMLNNFHKVLRDVLDGKTP